MLPTIGNGPIYFLAEAPGVNEDEVSHKPLTGPSGKLLRECIPDGLDFTPTFDNQINCRPPKNRTPVWQEIECCRSRRIKYIEQVKPKLIVGLGALPMHAILGSMDLSGMRGRLFAVKIGSHECYFLPTYHPSFILRTAFNKKKPLNSKLGHCFRMDIKRAFEVVGGLKPVHIDTEAEIRSGIQCFDGSEAHHFNKVLELIAEAKKAPIKAVDIETKGLRPFSTGAAIMSMAVSHGKVNFSFAWDHPKSQWSEQQKLKIGAAFQRLLKDDTIKIAHNAPFEIEWFIWLYGKDVVNHKAWHCTQMQAHFLDERRGKQGRGDDDQRAPYQNLNFLVKQHFGIAFKSLFKMNKKDMSKSDLGEMLIYNGVDTKVTLRLHHTQVKLLQEQGLYDAYLEALPRQPTVAIMQTLGVTVDQAEVKRAQKQLEGEIKPIEAEIKSLSVVKQYISDHKEFNPASNDDVLVIFKDYLHRKEVEIKEGDKVKFSVDKNILDTIDHPLAELIVRLRNRAKLKSTYVDSLELGVGEFIFPDGKLHPNLNTTFAETGRTSSDSPNCQNFPQRNDAWVRKQVVAPKGHVLVAFDYGQLEGCTAAMCSKDKVLIKALWEDYDIHMEWAVKTAKLYPQIVDGRNSDKAVMKKFRSLIKNKLVFPAIFGAQNKSIAGYLNMPEDVIDKLMDEFWSTFSGLYSWQNGLMKTYYETGSVASPTGRPHRYPLTRNQAINHPVQSLACDIVCSAMNELSMIAAETNQWHLHPVLNIHDDLTLVIPDDDKILEESIDAIYRVMLTPPYKCVNVPLSVSASIGPAWYGMSEIGKFWSHRDL